VSNIQAPPSPGASGVDSRTALELLRTMWRVRAFEERVAELTRAGEVPGLVHLSTGQEGVAAAVCQQLRPDDVVYTGHRGHGHAVAKGAPVDRLLAELMGRADGVCHGKGGSMHLVDVAHGLLGATGVVGGNIPLALGNSLAVRLRGGDQATVVFFGDGAVQAGHFHESVNLATLWQLPTILVCENNGFAEFTPRSAHTRVERVSDVVAPYGLERETVDGNDVLAVYHTFGRYLAQVRQGRGPMLLECLTHRLRGHYEGDPEAYRQAIAAAEWQQRDPIVRLARRGVDEGWFSPEDAAAAEADARQAVADAARVAAESPWPSPDQVTTEVYAAG
jgi:pyruvate dehydrogenase E1 component alpha subunit